MIIPWLVLWWIGTNPLIRCFKVYPTCIIARKSILTFVRLEFDFDVSRLSLLSDASVIFSPLCVGYKNEEKNSLIDRTLKTWGDTILVGFPTTTISFVVDISNHYCFSTFGQRKYNVHCLRDLSGFIAHFYIVKKFIKHCNLQDIDKQAKTQIFFTQNKSSYG